MRREFPKSVKRDAFLRANGCCEGKACGAKLSAGKFHYDHDIPDWMGGEPTLQNCVVLCIPCHKAKTKNQDMPAIAKTRRIRDREMNIRKPSRIQSAPFPRSEPQRSASRPVVKQV